MKHYFIGQFRWGVAHLVADDESILTVDASAIPDGMQEGADVCLQDGRFCLCPEREAHRAGHAVNRIKKKERFHTGEKSG